MIERNMETLAQLAAACSSAGCDISRSKHQTTWPVPEATIRRETAENSVLLALAICTELDKLLEKAQKGGAL